MVPLVHHRGDKAKKANFLFRIETLEKLSNFILEGERSRFVDRAVDEALVDFGRQKAMEAMERVRKEDHFRATPEEIRKGREYGRL